MSPRIAHLIAPVIPLACLPCAAEPVSLGQVGDARAAFDSSKGLGGLQVTVNGVTFRPFAGAGTIGSDDNVDPTIPLDIEAKVEGDVLSLTITSSSDQARGIDPGVVEGLSEWRRLDLSRYSEPYGQTWWPKTTYSESGDFWFTAHWVMEESDGTNWAARDQSDQGTGPFPAALAVEYAPDTAGAYLPIHEVLELRFSRKLWEVVPAPKQQPSEYRDLLAQAVFVDLWGGQSAAELRHFLEVMQALSRGRVPFYTILENWSVGGWDALLPDSMWLPDYPPNPSVGTVDELRDLCAFGKTLGRFGFRTNYRVLRENSPSFRAGLAHYAVDREGKRLDYLRPADWLTVAMRAENEIRDTFAPNAAFTDQMTSGAAPWSWHDYVADGGSRSMRLTLRHQAALARLIKETQVGPLGSESLADQHLLGEFVDTGDCDVKDGHHRLFSPEYKLRRLQHLSGFHGMGLMYRFYEMPPFREFHSGTTTFNDDDEQLDDYRACEVLYGNGGYVCGGFANWRYYLTEVLLIGNLQRHYSGQAVSEVRYWQGDRWMTLEELVKSGVIPNIVPWNPQTQAFARTWIEYESGLQVMVNRSDEPLDVSDGIVLPKCGWVAFMPDGSLAAFSAYWPGTQHRVDYLRDDETGIEYLDPRGEEIKGVHEITLWENGKVVLTAAPERNALTVEGREMLLDPAQPAARTTVDFGFDTDLEGWRPIRGFLSAEVRDGVLALKVIADDPFLTSPRLRVDGAQTPTIEVRMRVTGGQAADAGVFYFTTEESPNWNADKRVLFDVTADGEWHVYRVAMAGHPKWPSGIITGLRLDPVGGGAEREIEIDCIRAAR
jgi:hypothetical protein